MTRLSALAMLMACGAGAIAQVPDSTLLSQAKTLVKQRDCNGAGRILAPLLNRQPPLAQAVAAMAACRIRAGGDPTESLQALQAALDQGSDRFEILVQRGDLYNDLRMFDRSEADLNEAVGLAGDSARLVKALNRRAWNHLQMRKAAQARADCERVLAMDSLNSEGLNNLAQAADQLGDTAQALRCLKAMIRIDPNDQVALLNTGFFLGSHGRHAEALEYYAQAERLGAKDSYFLSNRGFSRLGSGDLKGARKDVERSIGMNPNNPYAYRNLAHIELAAGDARKACAALERAIELGFTRMYGDEAVTLRKLHCH